MNEKARSRLAEIVLFWTAAILPFFGIFWINKVYGPYWFVTFLLIYSLIYRPILHILRLLRLNVIEEKDAWKFFIPFYQTKYIKALWLG
ncbi:MAG TPA: hypothetical protein VE467_04395 [Chryseolinea sp.]|jgi:hypothetical protein|nr:hypothetical protein [Chryseolinea sp.]